MAVPQVTSLALVLIHREYRKRRLDNPRSTSDEAKLIPRLSIYRYCNNVDPGIVSGMSQGINGLVPGAEYKITFWIFLLYGNRIPLLPLWGMAFSSTIATYTGPQLPNAVWTQVESSFIAASATDTFSVFVDGSKIAPGVSGTFYIDNFDMYRL